MKQIPKNITIALAGATACLSSVANLRAAETVDSADVKGWDVKGAVLFYQEPDRVRAIEPVITGTKYLDTDEIVTLKLVIDSLTGASASGAVASDKPQTLTTPSGERINKYSAGELPLDPTFLDTRVALSGSWERPISRLHKMTFGANLSTEYDYHSVSVNGSLARDLSDRNTTISAGLSLGVDSIEAVGGIPTAFGVMRGRGEVQPRQGGSNSTEDKAVVDLVIGLTKVIDKNSFYVLNYSFGQSDGYLNDPYKVISVVDGVSGEPLNIVFENRPDSRTKHAAYGQYKRNFGGDVLDASYRYSTDNFGIDSHTIDLKYEHRLNTTSYIKPHFRYYTQTAADFYTPYFVSGAQPAAGDSSSFATADHRMSSFVGTTIGLEYGKDNNKRPWSVSLEYYRQSGDEPANKIGQLANREINPDVDAVMVRFNFDF